MSDSLKKEAKNYDLESLKNSLEQHDENIRSIERAVELQEQYIEDEQMMIAEINSPDHKADPKHIEIDTGRLRDNISRHKSEIDNFKTAIRQEQDLRRNTERLIMYKEA